MQELVVKGSPNAFDLSRAVQEMVANARPKPGYKIREHRLVLRLFVDAMQEDTDAQP
jgi:hypothetical protein